ncbi:MAG: L,D-transpeptidase family protein [Actinomycetota bacterium]
MRSRLFYRLANASPLVQGLCVLVVLLLVLGVFEADTYLFGGKSHPKAPPVAASPTPTPSASDSPAPLPTASPTSVPIPVSSTVATAADFLTAYVSPSTKAKSVGTVDPHNLIGQLTPMLVVTSQPGWSQVILPDHLPNDTMGWVPDSAIQTTTVSTFILVNLAKYQLEFYDSGKLMKTYPVAIGASNTQTPQGMFFVWAIQPDPGAPYNPVIFGLSALSPFVSNWPDGGIVGIHGWSDTSVEGKAVSNGCIRMKPTDASALLATNLPLGTPVDVVASA